MSKMPWFRLYSEVAFDPKIEVISNQTGIDGLMVIGAWIKLLCLASESPVRGSLYVTFQERFAISDLATLLKIPAQSLDILIDAFIKKGMVDLDENGAYHISNWDERQFESDNVTERVQKHRKSARKQQSNVSETLQKQQGNVFETPSESDTESDTEIREESRAAASAPPSRQNSSLFPVAEALSKICSLDLSLNRGMLFREAKTLSKATGFSLDRLLADYGPDGAWYRCDWRGQKGEAPTPALIRQTWGNLKGPKPNGSRAAPLPPPEYTPEQLLAALEES